MNASELLEQIKTDLKDYPIDYLKNKANDDRYPDSITKRLAKYNSKIYDDIYGTVISDDFIVNDNVIENLTHDLDTYFETYGPADSQSRVFIKNISLYLVLISRRPLHPYSESKKDEVYCLDEKYYCKNRVKYIKDKNSLCRYCICQNPGYMDMF